MIAAQVHVTDARRVILQVDGETTWWLDLNAHDAEDLDHRLIDAARQADRNIRERT